MNDSNNNQLKVQDNDGDENPVVTTNAFVSNVDDMDESKKWIALRNYLASKGNYNNHTTSNMYKDDEDENDDDSESDNDSDPFIPIYHADDDEANNNNTIVKSNNLPLYIDEDAIYDCFQLAIQSHNHNRNLPSSSSSNEWHPKLESLNKDDNNNNHSTNNPMNGTNDLSTTGTVITDNTIIEHDIALLKSWDPKPLITIPSWALNITMKS